MASRRLPMVAALLAALVAAGTPALAQDEETVPIQRHLEGLRLGDFLKEVQQVYPPLREWRPFREPGGRVLHYQVERASAKNFPREVDQLKLGFKWGQLASLQVVYSDRQARIRPLEKIVLEFSMLYGEPKRRGLVYSWQDGKTVLRAFNEEVSAPGSTSVQIRPSVEVSNAGLRERE